MNLPFDNLKRNRKIELAVLLSVSFLIYKLVFSLNGSFPGLIANEFFFISSVYFWLLYSLDFLRHKLASPISIVLNIGIFSATVFFIISVSSFLMEAIPTDTRSKDIVDIIYTFLISYIFIGIIAYVLASLRELFFYRQPTTTRAFFNTMLLFIFLAVLGTSLGEYDPDLKFLRATFFVISIILIVINSLKVAWIAFLNKKQKIYLLIVSVILAGLFGINSGLSMDYNFIVTTMESLSPGLKTLLNITMIYGAINFTVIFFTTLFHLPTAEAFDKKTEEISSLMEMSKLITQVFDFKELAETITSITTKVYNSDSAWLSTGTHNGDFELSSVNNIGYIEAEKLTNKLLNESDYDFNTARIINDQSIKINLKNDVRTFKFNSLTVAPLRVHDEINGYLFVARKSDLAFTDDDCKAIGAYADYAAVALENAKLIKESLEKERLEKELDVAREIQYKILPNKTPKHPCIDISALFIPAFEVGGDYYDFFELGDDKLGFVVADVSGKGISAAFVMAEVKGIFESLSKLVTSPSELLKRVNDILVKSLEKKVFVTGIYGIIDRREGKLLFSRAGHTPLHLFQEGKIKRITPKGIGLGLDGGDCFNANIKEMEIKLNNNDIIILYSDGITESQNTKMEDFGFDRLDEIVIKNSELSPELISQAIMKEVTVFSSGSPQHDDITLLIFKWISNN